MSEGVFVILLHGDSICLLERNPHFMNVHKFRPVLECVYERSTTADQDPWSTVVSSTSVLLPLSKDQIRKTFVTSTNIHVFSIDLTEDQVEKIRGKTSSWKNAKSPYYDMHVLPLSMIKEYLQGHPIFLPNKLGLSPLTAVMLRQAIFHRLF
jgi:hypothetical protein